MNSDTEIHLPETTMTYSSLKNKMSELYGLDVVDKRQKYVYVSLIVLLSGILIYKCVK